MDKIKKLQIDLQAAKDKLALAKKENKTAAITLLTFKISTLEKRIARLMKGEKTGAGKVIQKIKAKGKKVLEKKNDSIPN